MRMNLFILMLRDEQKGKKEKRKEKKESLQRIEELITLQGLLLNQFLRHNYG